MSAFISCKPTNPASISYSGRRHILRSTRKRYARYYINFRNKPAFNRARYDKLLKRGIAVSLCFLNLSVNVAVWGACKIKSGMEFYAGICRAINSGMTESSVATKQILSTTIEILQITTLIKQTCFVAPLWILLILIHMFFDLCILFFKCQGQFVFITLFVLYARSL